MSVSRNVLPAAAALMIFTGASSTPETQAQSSGQPVTGPEVFNACAQAALRDEVAIDPTVPQSDSKAFLQTTYEGQVLSGKRIKFGISASQIGMLYGEMPDGSLVECPGQWGVEYSAKIKVGKYSKATGTHITMSANNDSYSINHGVKASSQSTTSYAKLCKKAKSTGANSVRITHTNRLTYEQNGYPIAQKTKLSKFPLGTYCIKPKG